MYQKGEEIILYQRDEVADEDVSNEDIKEEILDIIVEWAEKNKGLMLKVRAALEYQDEFHEIDATIICIDRFRNIVFDENPFQDKHSVYYKYHLRHEENKLLEFKYMPEASENRSLMNIDFDYDIVWTIYYPAGESGFNKVLKGQLEII